jgi:tetratricopeptide (TPR) repeat protein
MIAHAQWSRLTLTCAAGLLVLAAWGATAQARSQHPTGDMGTCYRGHGKPAIAACSRLIASGRYLAIVYTHRGRHYFEAGDFDRAIADYNKALRLDPQWDAYFQRSLAYRKKGDRKRATADCKEANRLVGYGNLCE